MVDVATLQGGSTALLYTGPNKVFTDQAFTTFDSTFASDEVSAYNIGSGAVPSPSTSTNNSLVVGPTSTNTTLPNGYTSVFDIAGNDSVYGGDNSLTAYLQGGLAKGTVFDTGTGNDLIYAGGPDTILAGSGSNTIYGGAGGVTATGGTGKMYFAGGAGSVSAIGGQGDTTLLGGAGGTSYLQGGSGNNVLVAGSGTASSVLVGGANATEFGFGDGLVSMVAGTGTSIMNGLTGNGQEIMYTSSTGTAVMALNDAADTVVGGGGASTVVGGTGSDVFGFIAGHAGGTELILNMTANDIVVFGNYGATPITNEAVTDGSDVVTLADNTTIIFGGVDHKIFNNLQ